MMLGSLSEEFFQPCKSMYIKVISFARKHTFVRH